MTHTLGPWKWFEDALYPEAQWREWDTWRKTTDWKDWNPPPDAIVETDCGHYGPNDDDRALIAAAPDLLKELKHLVRLLAPVLATANVPGLATLNGAEAAIAKAEGKP